MTKEIHEWLDIQFAAGRKDLVQGDPFWRDHWLRDSIEKSFAAGERVPLGVLMIGNDPPTPADMERGKIIAANWTAGKYRDPHEKTR